MGARHVTEHEFKNIKLLIQAGLKNNDIKKLSGRSPNTIERIHRSDTLADYQKLTATYSGRYRRARNTNSTNDNISMDLDGLTPLKAVRYVITMLNEKPVGAAYKEIQEYHDQLARRS